MGFSALFDDVADLDASVFAGLSSVRGRSAAGGRPCSGVPGLAVGSAFFGGLASAFGGVSLGPAAIVLAAGGGVALPRSGDGVADASLPGEGLATTVVAGKSTTGLAVTGVAGAPALGCAIVGFVSVEPSGSDGGVALAPPPGRPAAGVVASGGGVALAGASTVFIGAGVADASPRVGSPGCLVGCRFSGEAVAAVFGSLARAVAVAATVG